MASTSSSSSSSSSSGSVDRRVQIFVRYNGKTFVIDIDPDTNVAGLRRLIEARVGVPADSQDIVHAGKILGITPEFFPLVYDDSQSLSSYGVGREATLYLDVRPFCGRKRWRVEIPESEMLRRRWLRAENDHIAAKSSCGAAR